MTKGIKKLKVAFKETGLTHFGGITLVHQFCRKLHLKELLQLHIKFVQRNEKYHFSEIILALIYIIITGIQRINKTKILQYNGSFQKIIGLKKFPDPSVIRRFLHRLPPKVIRQMVKIHDQLRMKLFHILHFKTSVTFDIDPTALTVYGKQQRAKKGYNPKKRGRKCFCLMLCFEDRNQEFWHGSLYSGNISPVIVGTHFLDICLNKLPSNVKVVRLRLDAGFYSHKFVECIETHEKTRKIKVFYTIEGQVSNPIKKILEGLKYKKFHGDWEASKFSYQPTDWKKSYRFIVIRRPLPKEVEETHQLSLFELKGYGYRILVTNFKSKPENIWRFHCQRAKGAELNIKELKNSYPLVKIPTKSWIANVAYCQILLFAFNIINWFKRLCLPEEFRYSTLQTIREKFLMLPGKLIVSGHKNILKLPIGYVYKDLFEDIILKIKKLKLEKKNL